MEDFPTFIRYAAYVSAALAILFLRWIDARQQGTLQKHDFQIQTLWDFIMRRALAESLIKGIVSMNSPIAITENARPKYAVMAEEMQAWYVNEGIKFDRVRDSSDISDVRDLFLMVEHVFGDRLIHTVCVPNHMSLGDCVWGAIAIMREARRRDKPDSDRPQDTTVDLRKNKAG